MSACAVAAGRRLISRRSWQQLMTPSYFSSYSCGSSAGAGSCDPDPSPKEHVTTGAPLNFPTSKPPSSSLLSCRSYQTHVRGGGSGGGAPSRRPGSVAFADCESAAITDLFLSFAKSRPDGGVDEEGEYLCIDSVRELLASIGERPSDDMLKHLFEKADVNRDGKLHLPEFLHGADAVLGDAPARIVLVVGGPGSGKGLLCQRLSQECGVVHMSSGDLLRDEVERNTPLGRECADIMERGDLVSSAVITTLIRRRMSEFPGRRVLLDGFPRSVENANDFAEICGKPELGTLSALSVSLCPYTHGLYSTPLLPLFFLFILILSLASYRFYLF
mmetsp:Transcript_15905/g.32017  ORF Transcript_15905/g.32017 Transcript_15905/m.32017 type:complete len:331 (+) Transcript_15905:34-1026(+)